MAFLASLLASMLEWGLTKLYAVIAADIKASDAQAAQAAQDQAEATALQGSQTEAQADANAKATLDNL